MVPCLGFISEIIGQIEENSGSLSADIFRLGDKT